MGVTRPYGERQHRVTRGRPAKHPIRITQIFSEEELAQAFRIRMRVFVEEQGVPAEIELDGDDRRAVHFLARLNGRAVGTARIVERGTGAKIGRMAVLKRHRRRGIGTKLLSRAVATARRWRAQKIYLHAQVAVIGFYRAMGFRCAGPVFHEAGIPHRKMVLNTGRASSEKRHSGLSAGSRDARQRRARRNA